MNLHSNDPIVEDLLYIIAKNIHIDDLYNLSNCTVSLYCMMRHPIFIRNKLASIDSDMKLYIKKKLWNVALCIAAEYGNLEICKLVVSIGANKFNHANWIASFYGHLHICKYIISLGATNLNSALWIAAINGHLEICKYFVSLGVTNFNSAPQDAAQNGHLDVCKYLESISTDK